MLTSFFAVSYCGFSQGTWTQKANFGGGPRCWATGSFSIGNKGYIGLGAEPMNVKWNDFWEWDQATNSWTQKANFPGTPRDNVSGFSIGTKGYIGLGGIYSGGPFYSDFWEWDQTTNTWSQKTNFPSTARQLAVGFSIGNKGYIGTGGVDPSGPFYSDFWEWDQATNSWTQKANFAGTPRNVASGFSIGTKGYIGTGNDGSWRNDFWEWDQTTNTWTQKANFGGVARYAASSFSIGTKGYIGTGYNGAYQQDFWEWDQATNVWTQKANFGGGLTSSATGFSIGNCGYIGTGGSSATGSCTDAFWEFCPNSSCCNILNTTISSQNVLCFAQCTGTGTANPSNGTSPYTYNWNNGQTTQTTTGLCAGNYSVLVTDASSVTTSATVTITQPTTISSSANSTPSTCLNNNGSATITANGGTPAYSYSWNPSGQITQTATGLIAGTYSAIISDANGCTSIQTVTVTANNPLTVTTSSTQTGCTINNGTALANPSNGTAPYTYNWSNGQTSQTVTGLGVGTYTVLLTDANGCAKTQTVTVISSPGLSISVSAATNILSLGDSTQLSATGGGTYQWSPSTGLNCTTCANPIATPAQTTTYCVLVTDSNGCTNSACLAIEILCGTIFIPNAFSPNGDNENDILLPMGTICIKTFSLVIYNRWGEKVFETTDVTKGWDGKLRGKTEDSAVFIFYLEGTYISGNEFKKKGNISLLR